MGSSLEALCLFCSRLSPRTNSPPPPPQKRISRIDSRNAKTSKPHDKQLISAAVEATTQGFEGVNRRVVSRLRQRLQEMARDALKRPSASPGKRPAALHPDIVALLESQGASLFAQLAVLCAVCCALRCAVLSHLLASLA